MVCVYVGVCLDSYDRSFVINIINTLDHTRGFKDPETSYDFRNYWSAVWLARKGNDSCKHILR